MKIFIFSVLVLISISPRDSEAGTRCSIFGNSFCRWTCRWFFRQTEGSCDQDNECICSGEEHDRSESIKNKVTKVFDIDIGKKLAEKVQEFESEVATWQIKENIKSIIPSRCKTVGEEFCKSTCQTIGRVNGVCNEDNSDCDCSDETVSPQQWALCVEDLICRSDCQRKGYSTGKCSGKDGWDCMCHKNDIEGNNTMGQLPALE